MDSEPFKKLKTGIKLDFSPDERLYIRTLAYMLYYKMPRKGNVTFGIVKNELSRLLYDKGVVGTKSFLEEDRFNEYQDRAAREMEFLLAVEVRIKQQKQKNKEEKTV